VSILTLKEKSWVWYLTYPFAHNNLTTIGEITYHPKGWIFTKEDVVHEQTHREQQREVGVYKFIFLYMFCFPLFWNKWRFNWEMEAHLNSGIDEIEARLAIRSKKYGWLLNRRYNDTQRT